MSFPEYLTVSFSFNPVYLAAGAIFLLFYSVFTYKFTIPPVAPLIRIVMMSLRFVALLIILFAIFEPVLTLVNRQKVRPTDLVFIDNSLSMNKSADFSRGEKVFGILEKFKDEGFLSPSNIFSFGSKTRNIDPDSLRLLDFKDRRTNFEDIFKWIKEADLNISSVTVLSDGIITEGINPGFAAEKTGIPVYTIGIGDTAVKRDIAISKVLFNEYIFSNNSTKIIVTLIQNGFQNQAVRVTLSDGTGTVESKEVRLSDITQEIEFQYTPSLTGEIKLTADVSILKEDSNQTNNRKIFYLNVLKNRFKVLIISASPNSDLTFIKNSLKQNPSLLIETITQISRDSYLESLPGKIPPDSADIFFLIGFPGKFSGNPRKTFRRAEGRASASFSKSHVSARSW